MPQMNETILLWVAWSILAFALPQYPRRGALISRDCATLKTFTFACTFASSRFNLSVRCVLAKRTAGLL